MAASAAAVAVPLQQDGSRSFLGSGAGRRDTGAAGTADNDVERLAVEGTELHE